MSTKEIYSANNRIPYALLKDEISGSYSEVQREMIQILRFYQVYKEGIKFDPEGTGGDYVASNLRYKLAASLINKEARFLFAETPDFNIEAKGDLGKVTNEAKDAITVLQSFVTTVLEKNKIEDILIKAARDCFISKRVAAVLNFNEQDGITITFLNSLDFVYETQVGNPNLITKFVAFIILKDRKALNDKRILKKKFTLENGKCFVEESIHDGTGKLCEEMGGVITPKMETELDFIPAVVMINDGLTGETSGVSEIENIMEYEKAYSKLANADIDSERKSMNPIRYTIDMSPVSTKGLSSSPGSFWDLSSDANKDDKSPSVGMLESNLSYADALKITLDRIKTTAYEELDVPNISDSQLKVTSGKELKAIYWPLIVRCKEKMKVWAPQLQTMIDYIIKGAMLYPECITKYTDDILSPVAYEIKIENNYPLPEDESEEKQNDLAEVNANVMSKKSYMKKWRLLTDQEADDELLQIQKEREMLEDGFGGSMQNDFGEVPTEETDDVIEDDDTVDEDLYEEELDEESGDVIGE